MDRRTFLALTAAGCASTMLPACATTPTLRPSTTETGSLRIDLAELAPEHDAWYVATGAGPLILMRADESFSAVSGICTHLDCRIRLNGNFLRCPCHGSTFEPDGTVIRGPAKRPLPTFAVRIDDDSLEITVPQS